MAELTVRVGRCSLAGEDERATTATAYAGFSSRHLIAVSDGALGPVPTVAAAQSAVASLLAGFRRRPHSATPDRMAAGFRDAHAGIRRAAMGTHAEHQAGAELAAVVIEPERLWVGLLGGGRAWVIHEGEAVEIGATAASGYAGDGVSEPSLAALAMPLTRGDMVVLATEATARTLSRDLGALARGSSPQLIAQALVNTARRRGASGSLTLQVVEVQSDGASKGGHTAVSEMAAAAAEVASRRRPGLMRRLAPLLLVAAAGGGLGGLAAWLHAPRAVAPAVIASAEEAPEEADAGASSAGHTGGTAVPGPTAKQASDTGAQDGARADAAPGGGDAPPPAAGGPVDEAAQAPGPDLEEAETLRALFAEPSPRRAARKLSRHLASRYRRHGAEALSETTAWLRANRSPEIIEVMVHLIDQRPRPAVRRWARATLASLYD